jgi:hypothetical protein
MHELGIDVMSCCHTSVPRPKKMHQTHCSRLSGDVEKAQPPNSMMKI